LRRECDDLSSALASEKAQRKMLDGLHAVHAEVRDEVQQLRRKCEELASALKAEAAERASVERKLREPCVNCHVVEQKFGELAGEVPRLRERVTHLTSALADETAGRREAERQLRGPCLKCGEMKHELEQANFQIEDLRAKVLQAERQVEDLLVMQREQQRLKESLPCALCADLRQQIDAKSREMELSRATLMSQRKELGDARKAQEESNSKLEEAWRTADAEHAERQHVNDILKKLLAEHDFTPASPQPHPSHRRNVTVRTGDQPHWQHQQSMRVNRSRAVPSWSSDEGRAFPTSVSITGSVTTWHEGVGAVQHGHRTTDSEFGSSTELWTASPAGSPIDVKHRVSSGTDLGSPGMLRPRSPFSPGSPGLAEGRRGMWAHSPCKSGEHSPQLPFDSKRFADEPDGLIQHSRQLEAQVLDLCRSLGDPSEAHALGLGLTAWRSCRSRTDAES